MRLVMPAARVPVEPGRQTIRLIGLCPQRSYGRLNYRWAWEAANGAGLTSFTTGRLGEGSKARALLEALMGHPLAPGAELDDAELVGRTLTATLIVNGEGHPRITEVAP